MNAAKILVVGAAEAGKSTLVRVIGDSAINLEHRGRTVALDHSVLRIDGAFLSLVGVPGQHRFAVVREALSTRAAGAVWVHAADSEVDAATANLLLQLGTAIPYLVLVNVRSGIPRQTRLEVPAELHPPTEQICGDLVHDSRTRERLRAAISRLVSVQRP